MKSARPKPLHRLCRIPVIYLEAMEAGNWKAFPAEVYLIGFLQKYSKYLGLDPKESVEIYRREQEAQNSVKQEEVKKVLEHRVTERTSASGNQHDTFHEKPPRR